VNCNEAAASFGRLYTAMCLMAWSTKPVPPNLSKPTLAWSDSIVSGFQTKKNEPKLGALTYETYTYSQMKIPSREVATFWIYHSQFSRFFWTPTYQSMKSYFYFSDKLGIVQRRTRSFPIVLWRSCPSPC